MVPPRPYIGLLAEPSNPSLKGCGSITLSKIKIQKNLKFSIADGNYLS